MSSLSSPSAETGVVTTSDGVRVTYYDTGAGSETLVLVNGLGGPFASWSYLVDYLRPSYRLVSWDYRGLFASALDGRPADVSVERHAADLDAVLAALGVAEPVTLIGWSMGVQVALETTERHPERVRRLVLINGTFGRPLDTVPVPGSQWWAPRVLELLRALGGPGESVLRRASHWPEIVSWMKRFGVVAPTMDSAFFESIAREFGKVDLDTYLRTLGALGQHDAAHVLEEVTVPTLLVTGERDRMTPSALAIAMAHRIRDAELLVVRGGTHYTAIEYPELVNLRVEKFLREH